MKRLIVLLGVVGVSLSAVFVRSSTAPSLILVLYRMSMAAILLFPVVLLKHHGELRQLKSKEILLCLVSGAFLGVHFATYFESLRFTSIASAVVLVNTEVLVVAVATVVLFKQKLRLRAWLAVVLAFSGSVIIAAADTAVGADVVRGDMLALVSSLCIAVYTMIGAVCRRRISTTVYTFFVYFAAAMTALVIACASGTRLFGYEPVNYLTTLCMTLCCTLMGHSLFSWGLKYVSPAFVATIKLLEPVLASLWGLLLFREYPSASVLLGGAVIIFGVGLYTLSQGKGSGEK